GGPDPAATADPHGQGDRFAEPVTFSQSLVGTQRHKENGKERAVGHVFAVARIHAKVLRLLRRQRDRDDHSTAVGELRQERGRDAAAAINATTSGCEMVCPHSIASARSSYA